MSTPNISYTNLDARYAKPSDVAAAIANQAVSDSAKYAPLNQLGSASNPVTSATAVRPTGLTKVFWQCPTQPTNWVAGDEWVNNS